MKRPFLIIVLLLTLSLALAAACGGAAPAPTVTVTKTAPASPVAAPTATVTVTQTAPAAPPVTVTITPTPPKLAKVIDSKPTGGIGPFIPQLGKDLGFFKKHGIDIEVKTMETAAARVGPFVGQADISTGDILPLSTDRKDIKIIGPMISMMHSLVILKDSPYQSYRDLKGKKIGITGPATSVYQAVKVFTKLEGLNMEKDFQLIIGEPAVQIGWLLNKQVDAIHINEVITSKLLVSDGDKVRELYWLNDLYKQHTGDSWLYGGVYTSGDWAQKNPELARELGLSYDDTIRYALGHPNVFKSDFAKKMLQVEDPKVVELLVQRLPRVLENPPYGPVYKAALVKQIQLLDKEGLLPAGVTVDWYKNAILFAED